MNQAPVTSPWAESADKTSPDGRYRATIADAIEIRMGAPTSGRLAITDNLHGGQALIALDQCNPSFVWSTNSDALAVPRWTRDLQQRLLVIAVPSGHTTEVPDEFRLLELHSFDEGVVHGVDSPLHMPVRVQVRTTFGGP